MAEEQVTPSTEVKEAAADEDEARQTLDDLTVLQEVNTVNLDAEQNQGEDGQRSQVEDLQGMSMIQMGNRDIPDTGFANALEDGEVAQESGDIGSQGAQQSALRGAAGGEEVLGGAGADGFEVVADGQVGAAPLETPEVAVDAVETGPGESDAPAAPELDAVAAPEAQAAAGSGLTEEAPAEEQAAAQEDDADSEEEEETFEDANVAQQEDGTAESPALETEDASGSEDGVIPLNISTGLSDTDGSETLSITIGGVPDGVALSAGSDNGDGTWTLTAEDLDGLYLTLPENDASDFSLTVTATSTETANGATNTVSGVVDVSVDAVADTPTLNLSESASGTEDQPIALDLSAALTDTDGSESLSITLSGVPDGATFSAGTDNGDGTWSFTADELDGLTITPPENSSDDFTLSVTATSTEAENGDAATSTGSISVSVEADADAPTLVMNDAAGTEDQPIALDLSAALVDTDGSESLSITIEGAPDGAIFSAGSDNGDGSWTFTADELDGLTITPPADSDGDFTLSVTAITTDENGDTATTSGTIDVAVAADADAPVLNLTDAASGTEDQPIALDLSSALTDVDGSESLAITISGVPDGAAFSAGTDNGDGTWSFTADELDGLTITPPHDSGDDFTLSVTATTTEAANGDTASTTGTIDVSVAADADAPTLVLNDAAGTEDQPIALDLSSALTDVDGSESLAITLSGVPDGAAFSAGTDNGDGSWTFTADELDGLTITPPADSDVDFTLSVTATATEGENGDTATTSGTIDISVAADADAPTLVLNDAAGTEDQPIALDLSSALTDTDGSESLSITIEGAPDGATFSAGTDNGDGTWTFTADELDGLTITPPHDSGDDFTLSVTATTTEAANGDTAVTTGTIDVSVAADADAPVLNLTDTASGVEDQPIALDLSSALTDVDGSESLSITIGGVPDGAAFSAGTDNGDGTWTFTANELDGLTITPPADSDVDFTLSVTATSTEGENGDTATTSGTINVSVAADADAPTLVLNDAAGTEDQPIALDLSSALTDVDGSESLSITIEGVPDGAAFSAGTDNGDGSWTFTADELDGLTITPPADSDVDFTLSVTATSTEAENGDTAATSGTIDISVAADADAPVLNLTDTASGTEDQPIALDLSSALTDVDGSESLSITLSGVPDGAAFSAGTDNGDGTWTFTADELDGLTITPPADSDVDFTLSVTATSTEAENGDTATTTGTIDVSVAADADAPTLVLHDAAGTEDQPIALDLSSALTDTDGSESLSITLSGVPDGAAFSAGTDNGDGTWTFTADELDGLTITPPADSDVDFTLSVTATSTEAENGDTATTSGTIDISVAADADAPTLVLNDAAGTEDQPIVLDLSSALTDVDGSESLSITLSGVPDGAAFSAGTDNGDGTWTFNADELDGLTITPPADSDVDFTLSVTATSTEGENGDTATTSGTIDISVAADADAPTLVLNDAAGTEDQPIALDLSSALTDVDGSESLSITIEGVPDGAAFSAGTDNGDGTWTFTADELDGLTITPPADSDVDFTLSVTATSTEAENGDTATTTGTIDVSVAADADAPTLVLHDAAGTEEQPIALDLSSALTDVDGSESLSITLSGVPDGAAFSAGTDNGDGTWTFTADELDGLTITPPHDSSDDFTLSVTATSTEGENGDTATTSGTINVSVAADADAPTLVLNDAAGTEDQPIALDLSSALTDTDGSETLSITIGGVPDGATFSAGSDNGDGTWTFTADELDGLTITPPADSDVDFTLSVTATSTEAENGDTATTTGTIDVSVAADADAPTLVLNDAAGTEDQPIALDLSSALTDVDGSESLSITIAGAPDGATFSAGTDNGDGSWTFTADELDGLTITPPHDSDVDFTLSVTATSTEAENGDTATATGTIDVSVAADADAPTLVLNDAAGTEDQPIALDLSSALTDVDGSESLSITISGVPDGATFSAGTDNGDGSWSFTADQLDGLTITPPENSSVDFTLNVSATSTEAENGDTATTLGTLNVAISAQADAVVLNDAAAGTEDQPIALNLIDLNTLDDSETLTVTIEGAPDGATFSAGTDNGDGSWSFTADDLDGLTITPPADSDVDFSLSVTATTTEAENGDTNTVTGTVDVSVAADADAPILTLHDAAGTEDQPIALDLTSALTDVDGSETLAITISGVPDGASFSAGSDNGDGSWTFTADELDGLTITPPHDSDVDFTLSVTATSTEAENGDSATTTGTIAVSVAADADMPTLVVDDSAGTEDHAISLDIASSLSDVDGSESLAITIEGVPDGATLSAGTENPDGSWSVSGDDLADLTITPPDDWSGTFDLTITATATEAENGDTASTAGQTITVTVNPDVDAISVTGAASGLEDQWIDVTGAFTLGDADGSESVNSVTISGLPDGAALQIVDPDSGAIIDLGTSTGTGDTFTIPAQYVTDSGDGLTFNIEGMQVMAPADSNVDFDLSISANITDANGLTTDVEVVSDGFTVEVTGVADGVDASSLSADDVAATEDKWFLLNDPDNGPGLNADLIDTDGSEAGFFTLSSDESFKLQVYNGNKWVNADDNADGSYTVSAEDVENGHVRMAPPSNSDESFDVDVSAFTRDYDEDGHTVDSVSSNVDTQFTVTVDAVADKLTIKGSAEGTEDTTISIDNSIMLQDRDGSESLDGSIVISGIPDGAALSIDGPNAGLITDLGDGSYEIDLGALTVTHTTGDGVDYGFTIDGLTYTPAANDSSDPKLTITSSTIDSNGDTRETSKTFTVEVTADADGATLSLADAAGNEDSWIDLNPSISLTADLDGSEQVSSVLITSSDPGAEGAVLEVNGQTIQPTVTRVRQPVTDGNGDVVLDDQGAPMTTTITTTAWAVPTALLEAVTNGDGQTTGWDFPGMKILPPSDSDADFELDFTVAINDDGEDIAIASGTMSVDVAAVADAPELTAQDVIGTEDSAISLNIVSQMADVDGSESLSFVISGVPDGATLSAGTDNGDGAWTLSADDMAGLTVTPPPESDVSFDLTVTATSTESNPTTSGDDAGGVAEASASVSQSFTVFVTGDADEPVVPTNLSAHGVEDQVNAGGAPDGAINLDLTSITLGDDADNSEQLSVIISDLPDGATLWIDDANADSLHFIGNGRWQIDSDALGDVYVVPQGDFGGTFDLSVDVVVTEKGVYTDDNGDSQVVRGGDQEVVTTTLTVTVDADADQPIINVSASGLEDQAGGVELNLSALSGDVDGSETITSITIDDVPDGVTLMQNGQALVANVDGEYVFDIAGGDSVEGITLITPEHSNVDFDLSVSATAMDSNGDTQTHTVTETVNLTGVADGVSNFQVGQMQEPDTALHVEIAKGSNKGDAYEFEVFVDGDSVGVFSTDVFYQQDGFESLTIDTIDFSQVDPDSITISPVGVDSNMVLGEVRVGDSVLTAGNATGDFAESGDVIRLTNQDKFVTFDSSGVEYDAPHLQTGEVFTDGAHQVAIDISADMIDADGSEELYFVIQGVPDGAMLAAGVDGAGDAIHAGMNAGNGVWIVTEDQLADLHVAPADGMADGDSFTLTITAVTHENDGDYSYDDQTTLTITMDADYDVGDAPGLGNAREGGGDGVVDGVDMTTAASGAEDASIAMNASITQYDGDSEVTVFVIDDADLPEGAALSGGVYNPLDGTWVFSADEMEGLEIVPPADFSGTFEVSISAITTEANGEALSQSHVATVDVDAVTDGPNVFIGAASGAEDTAIDLNLSITLPDGDGSESLSGDILISGVPDGATLSVGTDNGDGTWTISGDDVVESDGVFTVPNLTVTPPADSSADFDLTFAVTGGEGGTGAAADVTVTQSVTVTVSADADDVSFNLSVADQTGGVEDQAFTLQGLEAHLDGGGSETLSVVLSGYPDGTTFSAGANNGDGTWTLTPDELTDLQIKPPVDYNGTMQIDMQAYSMDRDADSGALDLQGSDTVSFTVEFAADADSATVTVNDAAGVENSAIALDLATHSFDASEGAVITLTGIPDGSTLSAGVENEDGSWTLTNDELPGLTLTPPTDYAGSFNVTMNVASDQNNVNTYESSFSFEVTAFDRAELDLGAAPDAIQQSAGSLALMPELSISDSDSTQLSGATVSIGDGADAADSFSFSGFNVTEYSADDGSSIYMVDGTNIQVSGGGFGGDGDLALSGADDVDTYQSLLQSLELNVEESGTRSINISVTDTDGAVSEVGQVDAVVTEDMVSGDGGDNVLTGTSGNDWLEGGAGDDILTGGAGDDFMVGDAGNDLFIFGMNEGSDFISGGDGYTDVIRMDGMSSDPVMELGDVGDWTINTEDGYTYVPGSESGEEFDAIVFDDADAAGSITLEDGSEIDFDGIEKIMW
ncbi:hypothetical protein [Magnetofaba australis]|uniref:Putative Hemolysin-type calcium-binding region n=1 Tax=Magnetofaba australis IT-1 TaxID=1434232 RepID=A0A1Y2K540_9PROT|nr:hypothetical protein [Magnetofaba australis]OSM04093.1 putative Hemolysin-type calcium-binding region [Magnetofaba australis IT-1]